MSIGWIITLGATVIYIVGGAFIWAVVRSGSEHRKPTPRPTLDALSLYILDDDDKHPVDTEYSQLGRESEWKR